jgi:hypothetical protein
LLSNFFKFAHFVCNRKALKRVNSTKENFEDYLWNRGFLALEEL